MIVDENGHHREHQGELTAEQYDIAAGIYWGEGSDPEHALVDDVWAERERQLKAIGLQTRPDGDPTLYDLPLQLARKAYDDAVDRGELSWTHILEEEVQEALAARTPSEREKELIQVAAVALSWVQDLRLKHK